MSDGQKTSILHRQLRVILERETANWSALDMDIIAFVKKHPLFYDGDRISWKKGKYQDLLNYYWNMFLKKSIQRVQIPVLNHRWMVIKSLYLNFYTKKINLDSKFFDGRLSFLNISLERKLRQTFSYGKYKDFKEGLQSKSITSPSPPSDMEIPLATHTSRESSNFQHSSSKVGINKTEVIEPKPTTPSSLLNVEVYKPGSLVSGTILEVHSDEENLSEADAFKLYLSNFCSDVRDEELLVTTNTTTSTSSDLHVSSSFPSVSVEKASVTLSEENKEACEESITYTVNANNDATSSSVPVAPEELEKATSPVDFRNKKVLVPPNVDTRDFFKGIGKYVANNFDDQKQNETRLEVWSLVTAAELELLDDD